MNLLVKIVVLAGALCTSALAQTEPVVTLQWLSGCWMAELPHVQMEEHWSRPGGGSMIGYSRVINKGRTTFIEYSRIQTQGAVTLYHAYIVAENRSTPFSLETCTADSVSFVNAQHDFPRQISYHRLHADTLKVILSGVGDGEAKQEGYRMHRFPCTP